MAYDPFATEDGSLLATEAGDDLVTEASTADSASGGGRTAPAGGAVGPG